MRTVLAFILLAILPAQASEHHSRFVWLASAITLGVSTGVDIASSLAANGHGYETNGLLRSGADSGFHARGVGISVGITSGILAGQALLRRHTFHRWSPENTEAVGSALNFSLAGPHALAAANNWRLPR